MAEVTAPHPLTEEDDRSSFDCGRSSLNHWFLRHAWSNHKTGVSRVNVICDKETGEIVGFVSLSSAQIERSYLAKTQQRNQPDPIPVTLLGQLAINKNHQRRGHARSLLLFALRTAFNASQQIGSFGVLTHPIDEDVRAFYTRSGFQNLPFDPKHALIVRMRDLEQSGIVIV
ncbi:MAG: GNAT family N-acetyltransferase [Thiothrix sp.]|nr:MAG: GNAT family N-acetyltransferase [Thiothrix sp.]